MSIAALKSPPTRQLFNILFKITAKKPLKPCNTSPFWEESTDGFPHEGQWCGKCFHAMTSSGTANPLRCAFVSRTTPGNDTHVVNNLDSLSNTLWPIVWQIFVLTGVVMVTAFLQVTCWTISGERQARRIRTACYRSMLSQEMAWYDQRSVAEMNTRITRWEFWLEVEEKKESFNQSKKIFYV